jgi:hypothetical protein
LPDKPNLWNEIRIWEEMVELKMQNEKLKIGLKFGRLVRRQESGDRRQESGVRSHEG